MAIKMVTPKEAVDAFLKTAARILNDEIFSALAYMGEIALIKIRDRSSEESWIDHTGNLRSSIGYSIYEHGKTIVQSAFAVIKEGSMGQSEGRKMVDELASKYTNTYALVVVAAMSYADYVEALKNKDVLASTESWARSKVDEQIRRAVDKATRKINSIRL